MARPLSSAIALFAVSLLWGASFVFTKGYLDVVHPVLFTAYAFLASGAVFLLISLALRKSITFRLREGVLLGVCLFFLEVPQMIGLAATTAANTAFITSVGILLVPFLKWLLYRHPVRLTTGLMLAVACAGVFFLTGGIRSFGAGDAWIALSAAGLMLYMVLTDHFEKEAGSATLVLCAQQFLTVGALALLAGAAFGLPFGLKTVDGSWMPLVALTFAFTLVPYLLLQWAERYASEIEVTFYSILEPLIGGIAAWTIGMERATPLMILGGMLIIGALAVSESHRLRLAARLRNFEKIA